MSVAHVFAETNIRHDDEARTLRLDRSHCLLHDAILGVRSAGRLVFLARNSEKQNSLQSQFVGPLGFVRYLVRRPLENSRHTCDRLPRSQLFADEKGENKIVRAQFRFPHEVTNTFAAAQTSGALNEFSHGPRLSVWPERRKFPELDAVPASRVNAISHARG